jgi:hypothetical protein
MNFGPLFALAPLIWIPTMLILARTIFGGLHRKRELALKKLFDRITRQSASWRALRRHTRASPR